MICSALAVVFSGVFVAHMEDAQPAKPAAAVVPVKPAEPAGPPPTTIVLSTGEVLRGEVIRESDSEIVLKHPVLGELRVPKNSLKTRVETPKDAPKELPAPQPPVVPAPPPPPEPASIWEGWKFGVDTGIGGSSGNSEAFSGRVGLGAKRITKAMDTVLDASYIYATSGGTKNKSRGEGGIRNDWKFDDSPWGLFAQARLEFDEFQNYKWRASSAIGPSYTFIKTDDVLLRGRLGLGGAIEWAGPAPVSTFVPEGVAGVDFNWKINERQSCFVTFDYLPSLRNPPRFRTDTKAGYQITVDPKTNMLLKIGAAHRYNSNPGPGNRRSDVDYFLTLGWEF